MNNTFNPVQTSQMSRNDKIKNYIWSFVYITFFRYSPSILSVFRKYRLLLLKCFGANLDWSVSIHPKAKIDYPWNLTMQNMSSLGENCWVYAMNKISIGEKTCIGKDVYLLTGSHDVTSPSFDLVTKPINIGNYCWLATGVTVLPGVSIEDGCVVSANSTVTKNIEPWQIIGGNPAKLIKKRDLKDA